MIRRRDGKKRARSLGKLTPDLREYLAFIGGRGGQKSRRYLDPAHAKQMVAIREAKKRAVREGRLEWALKRIPLSALKKRVPYSYRPATSGMGFLRVVRVPRP